MKSLIFTPTRSTWSCSRRRCSIFACSPRPQSQWLPGSKSTTGYDCTASPCPWRSRITQWDPPHSFVDEQFSGPYRYWHHLHTFTPARDGTLVRDVVEYSVLGGWLTDRLLVRRDLNRIFSYRQERLAEIFGGNV